VAPRRDQYRITVAADEGYDPRELANGLRAIRVTPQVAQHTTGCWSAIDVRTTRHIGYALSANENSWNKNSVG
jgi:hypothetical protein